MSLPDQCLTGGELDRPTLERRGAGGVGVEGMEQDRTHEPVVDRVVGVDVHCLVIRQVERCHIGSQGQRLPGLRLAANVREGSLSFLPSVPILPPPLQFLRNLAAWKQELPRLGVDVPRDVGSGGRARHEGREGHDAVGDFLGHPSDTRRRGPLTKPLVVGVAKPLVGGKVARHPSQPGGAGELIENRAHLAGQHPAGGAVGGESAQAQPAADRLDEGGGDIGVVGLVAWHDADAAVADRGHDAGDVVPEVDQPNDLVELCGYPGERKRPRKKIAGTTDPLSGAEMAFVAKRRGHDRAHQERPIDAAPGEAHGVEGESTSVGDEVSRRAEPPGQLAARLPPQRVPGAVGEFGQRPDLVSGQEVVEGAAVRRACDRGDGRHGCGRRYVTDRLAIEVSGTV